MIQEIKLKQYDGSFLYLEHKPTRIVSLVPSVTEDLITAGIAPIARTSYCIFPQKEIADIPPIGGTKSPALSRIKLLKPDLVIANKEENLKVHIDQLEQSGIKVWVQYPNSIESLFDVALDMSQIVADSKDYRKKVAHTKKRVFELKGNLSDTEGVFLFLIWKNPWMAAGVDTYIHSIFKWLGVQNCIETSRYPEIGNDQSLVEIIQGKQTHLVKKDNKEVGPLFIFLPSEPYHFKQKDKIELERSVRNLSPDHVHLVSGEDFTWPGFRVESALNTVIQVWKKSVFKRSRDRNL